MEKAQDWEHTKETTSRRSAQILHSDEQETEIKLSGLAAKRLRYNTTPIGHRVSEYAEFAYLMQLAPILNT